MNKKIGIAIIGIIVAAIIVGLIIIISSDEEPAYNENNIQQIETNVENDIIVEISYRLMFLHYYRVVFDIRQIVVCTNVLV